MVQLENNKELLDDRLSNGLMALPFLRTGILDSINPISTASSVSKTRNLFGALNFLKYPRKLKFPKSKVIIFSSTLFDIAINGRYLNQLHGFYKRTLPEETTVIEECDSDGKWRLPNEDSEISYSHTMIMFLCRLFAVFMSRVFGIKKMEINNIRHDYPSIPVKKLAYDNYLVVSMYWIYKRIFKRKNETKLIILNCASYGGVFAAITKAAHEAGIVVAETQHGMINDIHYVYNVEDFVFKSEQYRQYLPDYLLTFGQFWNDHSRIAVKKVIVGNPYLEFYKKNYIMNTKKVSNSTEILFISQPEVKDIFIQYAEELSSCTQYEIVLRLHPFDKISEELIEQLNSKGVRVSNSKVSLYDDILHASVIVGGNTTCLYEAMGLGRPILVYSTLDTRIMYNNNESLLFRDCSELLKKMESISKQEEVDASYYYVSNFEVKYKQFLEDIWK